MSASEKMLLPSTPCGSCGHKMGRHDHMFDEDTPRFGRLGRYRCNDCACGVQYAPRVYELKPGETPEQFMERVTAE